MNIPVGWFPVLTLLLGFVTALLGFVTASLTQFLQHRGTLAREREARREVRRERLADRRVEFQRQTLLDLQDAIQDLVRATGFMHHQDLMAYRATGRWQRQLLDEQLDQQAFVANRRLILLGVRVRDQSLRAMVSRFKQVSAEISVGVGLTPEASMQGMQELTQLLGPIHERIGETLRTLDDEEDASV